MDVLSLGLVWLAFGIAFMLGAAFAVQDVFAEKRYRRQKQADEDRRRHL